MYCQIKQTKVKLYSATDSSFDQLLCSEYIGVWSMHVNLAKRSHIAALFKVLFIWDFILFCVRLNHVSLLFIDRCISACAVVFSVRAFLCRIQHLP